MKTKYGKCRFAFILLAIIVIACSDSQTVATSTATNIPATATLTQTPPPTSTIVPTATAIPLAWMQVNDGQEFGRDTITAFVINPKDPEVLYVSMENAGIYKSIDGGLSWETANHGLVNVQVESLLIDFKNPQILYANAMSGIFKTEDGGENWTRLGKGIYLLMDSQDSSHLYARDSDGIYESTDQGKSWETVYSTEEICPGKIISWAIHPIDGKTLFIGAGEECRPGVYLSTDGGHTWAMMWQLQPTEYNYFQYLDPLAVGADKQGNYYIATAWGLLRSLSNNAGSIWKTIADFAPPATFDSTKSVYSYCDTHLCKFNLDDEQNIKLGKPDVGIVTSITVSPDDPNTIYIGGKGVSVSRDGGLIWTKLNNGLGNEKLQLDIDSGNMPVLYLQSGECGEVQRIKQKKHYLGAFQDDAGQPFYTSTDGGQTWELSLKNGCYLLKDANDTILYRVGQDWVWTVEADHLRRWLWVSRDQGKTWQGAYITDIGDDFTVAAHPIQSGVLYAHSLQTFRSPGYGGEKTFISEDYGNNWKTADSKGRDLKPCYGSTLQFIDKYRPMAIDPSDGNHVFVIDNGVLLESYNSCDTTETFETSPSTSMNSIAFDPDNPNTIYAGTDEGAYISFDSGKSWNQINDGLPEPTVVYSIVVDKDGNVYASTPNGIYQLTSK